MIDSMLGMFGSIFQHDLISQYNNQFILNQQQFAAQQMNCLGMQNISGIHEYKRGKCSNPFLKVCSYCKSHIKPGECPNCGANE